jgi:hypothetical protein
LSVFRNILCASLALLMVAPAFAQRGANNVAIASVAKISEQNDAASQKSIGELIADRIDKEWKSFNTKSQPELVKIEANYVRTAAASPTNILYEASFHLQPQYYSHDPTAPDTSRNVDHGQPVMYFTGSARTPFALPVVSNLSKALSGDEASYTVNLGILPLPYPGHSDSIRYYVVIERAIESNHTDNTIRFERFSKDFAARADEPVPLRLAEEVPLKGAYILQLENGSVLDFYDDFARFISEHILINSERLKFSLGKQTISDISSRLSIPYSVARTSNVKVQLVSVLDSGQALTIVDTMRQPADYLAELDMSKYADGPYKYRLIAQDAASGTVIYDTVAQFNKMTPVLIGMTNRLAAGDTLRVGGKKHDYAAELRALAEQLTLERVINERTSITLSQDEQKKRELQAIVDANKNRSIADIHARAGVGIGGAAGDNIFFGIESSKPALAMDVSFGYQYSAAPYLGLKSPPTRITELTSAPYSLGIHLSWMLAQWWDGTLQPLVSGAFYGTWTSDSAATRSTASLLGLEAGFASEPWKGLGLSLTAEVYSGLGIAQAAQFDANFRAYVRF